MVKLREIFQFLNIHISHLLCIFCVIFVKPILYSDCLFAVFSPIVTNPCAVNNGGCSHLCLIRAGGQGFTCECPDHFLTVQIGGVARCLPMCSSTQYRCADNERLAFVFKHLTSFLCYIHSPT